MAMRSAGVPLGERQLEPGDRKGSGDHDLMLRAFIVAVALFSIRPAHHELACRHYDHLGTVRAFLERDLA
jgi:hypothetical protein